MSNQKDYQRSERIAAQLKRALAPLIDQYLRDKDLPMLSITAVTVSNDLSIAKIHVSLLKSDCAKEVLAQLKKGTSSLRFKLAKEVDLRKTPDLRFYYDETMEYGDKLSKLIDEAVSSDTKKNK